MRAFPSTPFLCASVLPIVPSFLPLFLAVWHGVPAGWPLVHLPHDTPVHLSLCHPGSHASQIWGLLPQVNTPCFSKNLWGNCIPNSGGSWTHSSDDDSYLPQLAIVFCFFFPVTCLKYEVPHVQILFCVCVSYILSSSYTVELHLYKSLDLTVLGKECVRVERAVLCARGTCVLGEPKGLMPQFGTLPSRCL